jgi:hypothetical protein
MRPVLDENPHPGLPDTEIDDALADILAEDVETLPAKMLPPGASAVRFPDWFPENIRNQARFFLRLAKGGAYGSSSSSALAMVERLVCDPQMEAVWTQLLQKNRTTGGFRLAANLMTVVGRNRADEIHPASAIVVFRDAVMFGVGCFQFGEQKCTHYLEQAQELRSDARSLERMLTERRLERLSPRDVHRIAKKFDDAANEYQLLGDLVGARARPANPEPFDPDSFSLLDAQVPMRSR